MTFRQCSAVVLSFTRARRVLVNLNVIAKSCANANAYHLMTGNSRNVPQFEKKTKCVHCIMHVAAFVCVADNREVLFDTRTKAVMAQTDQPNDVKTKVRRMRGGHRLLMLGSCCWCADKTEK